MGELTKTHRNIRFLKNDLEVPNSANEVFFLTTAEIWDDFRKPYKSTANLYYNGHSDFDLHIERINQYVPRLQGLGKYS